jgi:NAD-dependent dihydropyrimidine dehydrogenase PreA subunit
MPGTFIDVEIDDSIREDPELARRLEDACPVDIFAARDGRVTVVEENLDECVLCELCVNAAPPAKLRVRKLYDGSALERTS